MSQTTEHYFRDFTMIPSETLVYSGVGLNLRRCIFGSTIGYDLSRVTKDPTSVRVTTGEYRPPHWYEGNVNPFRDFPTGRTTLHVILKSYMPFM